MATTVTCDGCGETIEPGEQVVDTQIVGELRLDVRLVSTGLDVDLCQSCVGAAVTAVRRRVVVSSPAAEARAERVAVGEVWPHKALAEGLADATPD